MSYPRSPTNATAPLTQANACGYRPRPLGISGLSRGNWYYVPGDESIWCRFLINQLNERFCLLVSRSVTQGMTQKGTTSAMVRLWSRQERDEPELLCGDELIVSCFSASLHTMYHRGEPLSMTRDRFQGICVVTTDSYVTADHTRESRCPRARRPSGYALSRV